MASFNLVRNSKVVFTTNVDSTTGAVAASGFTTANTQELAVLDGFTFTQATNADTITISEAGSAPVRGQRAFNTSLNAADFSFSTYLRPYLATTVKADESVLWNALFSDVATSDAGIGLTYTTLTTVTCTTAGVLTLTGTGFVAAGVTAGKVFVLKGIVGTSASELNAPIKITSFSATSIVAQYLVAPSSTAATAAATTASWGTTGITKFMSTAFNENASVSGDLVVGSVPYSQVTSALSNKNQLLKFGMIFQVDGVTYTVDNCAMDQASIDFGLDGIATIAWTGKGTKLNQLSTVATFTASGSDWTLGGGLAGTVKGKNTFSTNYMTNKLSTTTVVSNIGGVGGTAYTVALTGGNITIANNINYVVPANLGVVNLSIGYFTGTRSITGSMQAYLRTGASGTAAILANMLSNITAATEPKFKVQIEIGGSSALTRVEVLCDGAVLTVPTVDAQAVMSTTINFTAQGTEYQQTSTSGYDLENTNDVRIRYFGNIAS